MRLKLQLCFYSHALKYVLNFVNFEKRIRNDQKTKTQQANTFIQNIKKFCTNVYLVVGVVGVVVKLTTSRFQIKKLYKGFINGSWEFQNI